ncbi:MAG: hypothetical protein LKF58_03855 [Bacilli bacterium]|jgi:hypothetical protein|nr:hypothetical protein [Bacilli bacterium]MCH4210888.1 hypothetical protein [Bacilli bacterium]MCH4278203.1 hypothetical protein [Bacilli bacterium]MCI2055279.1 hypothetical protein [Bacilli bacterium]
MENKALEPQNQIKNIITSKEFLMTPAWGEFFYYAKDRDFLMDLYDSLLDEGFHSLEQPHEVFSDIFVARLIDPSGRHIFLRSV